MKSMCRATPSTKLGGACMGNDPRVSVVNRFSQLHDAENVFVTDGAQMASTSCVNPSMTFMALTARAADHAVKLVKAGDDLNPAIKLSVAVAATPFPGKLIGTAK